MQARERACDRQDCPGPFGLEVARRPVTITHCALMLDDSTMVMLTIGCYSMTPGVRERLNR
jgi:hypothetical protein